VALTEVRSRQTLYSMAEMEFRCYAVMMDHREIFVGREVWRATHPVVVVPVRPDRADAPHAGNLPHDRRHGI